MEDRQCIICKTVKQSSLFNKEHIIPAALGGNFVINTVCTECNSHLGEAIDKPLLNNVGILHYRNTFNLTRQASGSVPNPFKGKFSDADGHFHIVDYKDGEIVTQALERFEIKKMPDTDHSQGVLTIPKEKFNDADSIIKKYLKRRGIETEDYSIISIEENAPDGEVEINATVDHNTFIFGCVKIAYETINLLFPNALDDPDIDILRLFLKTGEITDQLLEHIGFGSKLNSLYNKKLATIEHLGPNHQLLIIEHIEGVGLICMVRLFHMMYPVMLSRSFLPISPGYDIVFFNDCLSTVHGTNINHTIVDTTMQIDLSEVSPEVEQQLRNGTSEDFFKVDGKVPIYDRTGRLTFNDIHDLGKKLLADHSSQFHWTQSLIKFQLEPDTSFVKAPNDTLLPFTVITLKVGVVFQKIAK